MQKWLSISLTTVVVLLAPHLRAQTLAIGQTWPTVIAPLVAKGITKVGGFDLLKFTQDAKALHWKALTPQQTRPLTAENRKSAFFDKSSKTVYIDPSVVQSGTGGLGQLEVHEALGALGYNDSQYQMSTALHLLNSPVTVHQPSLVQVLGGSVFSPAALRGGGGTSVGGGGDIAALLTKDDVLSLILNESIANGETLSLDFLNQYPQVGFEILGDEQQIVAVRYEFRSSDAIKVMGALQGVSVIKGRQERITIMIPAHASPAVVEEATEKIQSLLLTTSDEAATHPQIADCPAASQFAFPKTTDSSLQAIQAARAKLLAGCVHNERDRAMGSGELHAPAFNDSMWHGREAAGVNQGGSDFSCTFSANGRDYPFVLKTRPKVLSFSASTFASPEVDGSSLVTTASLTSNPDGTIAALQVVFANEDLSSSAKTAKKYDHLKRAKLDVQTPGGGAMTFACSQARE